ARAARRGLPRTSTETARARNPPPTSVGKQQRAPPYRLPHHRGRDALAKKQQRQQQPVRLQFPLRRHRPVNSSLVICLNRRLQLAHPLPRRLERESPLLLRQRAGVTVLYG